METFDTKFGKTAFNPQWEFGHGLSYSDFKYNGVKMDRNKYGQGDAIKVTVDVANASDRTGKEVVQVYVRDEVASIAPSVKRLRAFRKVEIPANTSQQVEFEIPVSELAFVNRDNEWVVEPGDFTLIVDTTQIPFSVE